MPLLPRLLTKARRQPQKLFLMPQEFCSVMTRFVFLEQTTGCMQLPLFISVQVILDHYSTSTDSLRPTPGQALGSKLCSKCDWEEASLKSLIGKIEPIV